MRQSSVQRVRLPLTNYLPLHGTIIAQFQKSGFITDHTIGLVKTDQPDQVFLAGEIACKGNVVLSMQKRVHLFLAEKAFEVHSYSYNARIHSVGNIFRYDDNHVHDGHPDEYHFHEYDWNTNSQMPGSPKHIGQEKWPRLGDVIEQLRGWHSATYAQLQSRGIAESFVPFNVLLKSDQVTYHL